MHCFSCVESDDTVLHGRSSIPPERPCRIWQEPGVLQNIPISDHWLLLARVTKTRSSFHVWPRALSASGASLRWYLSVGVEAM